MATQTLLTIEQFLELPDEEGVRLELDEGALIEMAPPAYTHASVVARIVYLLSAYAEQPANDDWRVAAGSGYALGTLTMRIPDVFLARKKSIDEAPVLKGNWLQGAPELCVEVVSPSDTAYQLDRRIHQFLDAGSHAVWVIYPESRRVVVHRRGGAITEHSGNDVLMETEHLPGLRIEVAAIFARL